MKCPNCFKARKEAITIYSFFPALAFKKCYNCRRKIIWIRFFNHDYYLQNESLLRPK